MNTPNKKYQVYLILFLAISSAYPVYAMGLNARPNNLQE